MENINYLAVFRDSFTLVILLFCSLLSLTFAFERWLFFRKARQKKIDVFLSHVSGLLKEGKTEKAIEYAAKIDSPVSRLFHYALEHRAMARKDLEELLATKRQEERLNMERNLGVLGTMGNIAPFIGQEAYNYTDVLQVPECRRVYKRQPHPSGRTAQGDIKASKGDLFGDGGHAPGSP